MKYLKERIMLLKRITKLEEKKLIFLVEFFTDLLFTTKYFNLDRFLDRPLSSRQLIIPVTFLVSVSVDVLNLWASLWHVYITLPGSHIQARAGTKHMRHVVYIGGSTTNKQEKTAADWRTTATTRMSVFSPNKARLATNETNPGHFHIGF